MNICAFVNINSRLNVVGTSTFNYNLNIKGNTTIYSTLNINGYVNVSSPMTINNKLNVDEIKTNKISVNNLEIKEGLNNIKLNNSPIGSIIMWCVPKLPKDYLICDGSELDKGEYPELFEVLEYYYGGEDNKFNLPNFNGKVAVGLDNLQKEFEFLGLEGGEKYHKLTEDELPEHSHTINDPGHLHYNTTIHNDTLMTKDPKHYPRFSAENGFRMWHLYPEKTGITLEHTGNNVPHNILQPYITTYYIIKAK